MRTATARDRAIANENRQIEESQGRAIAARQAEQSRPRNALEAMANRLQVSPAALKNTLTATVFKGCRSEEEFIALCLVSNEYRLNPLLKEIYAFPTKGGGITPMVSVDGWIKLMHSHPNFDNIDFTDIADERGAIYAIEATIYRTDKQRPTKVIEYLDECRGDSGPWRKSPLRMLRHRALIQCARIAFGFSGISSDGDETIDGGDITPIAKTLPSAQTIAEDLDDEIPNFDQGTGEVYPTDSRGMTEVDEETARQLDAGNDGTLSDDNPTAEEGPAPEQRGEADDEEHWVVAVRTTKASIVAAKTIKVLDAIERDWTNRVMNGVPDEAVIRSIDKDIANKRQALKQAEG